MTKTQVETLIDTNLADEVTGVLITPLKHRSVEHSILDYAAQEDAVIQLQVNAIKTVIGQGVTDGDTVVNTLTELLAAFQTYQEGVNIATTLATLQNKRVASVAITGTTTKTLTLTFADNTTLTTSFVDNDSGSGSGTTSWGGIAGTLSNQTDLVNALAAKAPTTSIGTLSSLTTSAKTNLVAAINEVKATADAAGGGGGGTGTVDIYVDDTTISGAGTSGSVLSAGLARDAAISAIRNGVVTAGNDLAKLYALIQTLTTLVTGTTPDGDSVTNTIQEIVTIFATYPEGVDIATAFSGKVDKITGKSLLSDTEITKLATVSANATQNITDTASAALMDSKDAAVLSSAATAAASAAKAASTITGTKTSAFISDFNTAVAALVPSTVDETPEPLTYSASLSVTYNPLRPNKSIDLTAHGNIAITNTGTNSSSGGEYIIKQDTTPRTVTINGTAIAINPVSGSKTRIEWIYDGADYGFSTNYTDISSTLTEAKKEVLAISCSDLTTALTTGTGKAYFRMPWAGTLTGVRLGVLTAPTGSSIIVNVKEAGTTVFSTKPSIAISANTSVGGTAAVISDSALADDAEITVDIDQVGSTIAGAGLIVYLYITRS